MKYNTKLEEVETKILQTIQSTKFTYWAFMSIDIVFVSLVLQRFVIKRGGVIINIVDLTF